MSEVWLKWPSLSSCNTVHLSCYYSKSQMLLRPEGLQSSGLVREVTEGCLEQWVPGILSNRRIDTGTKLKPLEDCEAGSTLDRAQITEGGHSV